MLRGGSWNNNERNARCANRNRNNPNNRNNNIGFRVAVLTFFSAWFFLPDCWNCGPGQLTTALAAEDGNKILWKNGGARSWPRLDVYQAGRITTAPRPGSVPGAGQRLGHMYEKLCSWENLLKAYHEAAKGKRGQPPAAAFEFRLEDHCAGVQPLVPLCLAMRYPPVLPIH